MAALTTSLRNLVLVNITSMLITRRERAACAWLATQPGTRARRRARRRLAVRDLRLDAWTARGTRRLGR